MDDSQRPNIVLLVSHDLGCHVGPYGWAVSPCPHLNRLAAEAMRFDAHFVTSPGCSQSRSSLVTGRYPHSNGQFGLAHLGWELNRDEVLLPAVLRDAGYQTVLFGIWHLHEWTLDGFTRLSDDVSTQDSSPEGAAEVAAPRAADWIRQHASAEQPFYLHVGFWETHRPFCGQDADSTSAAGTADAETGEIPGYLPDTPATRRELADLHRSVSLVDAGVGRVLDALEEANLRDNTLVLFTADHGLPFPRAKGTLYDPGLQVAQLIRWPGRVVPDTAEKRLTSNVDVMPTLLEAAGISAPGRVQGRSFLWMLDGNSPGANGPDAIYAEKTYHEHYDPIRCLRTPRYKYIRNFAERPQLVMPSDVYNSPTRRSMTDDEAIWGPRPPEELYDLQADPHEMRDLALDEEHAAVRSQLCRRLADWMYQTGDPLLDGPVPRPAVE